MKSELSNLLKDPRLEELTLSLHAPNIFTILNVVKTEIRHSNFLAWLMTPDENHNLNTIFIKWFLREIFSSDKLSWADEFTLDSIDLSNIQIYREWKNIDILILHGDFVIAIENKVHSSESSKQLKKYSKIVHDSFPDIEKAFVFLTIDGASPKEEEDASEYISIDYGLVKSVIQIVTTVYKTSLSDRIKYYIEDYLQVLNRYIMKEHDDKAVILAQELYGNHKDAIDFIILNKPDKIFQVRKIIEDMILEEGYVLETCHKYYARFLTEKLSPIIPKTGIAGFSGGESFLFEIAYWEKGLSLKFVISPGNEVNRKILSNITKTLPNSKKATGKKYLTYYRDPRKVNFLNEKYDNEDEIKLLIQNLLRDNKKVINIFETEVIRVKDSFEY